LKPLTILSFLCAVAALIVVSVREARTRHELDELKAAVSARTDGSGFANAPVTPSVTGAELGLLAAKLASLQATAAAPSSTSRESTPPGEATRPKTDEEVQAQVLVAYGAEKRDSTWGRDTEQKLDSLVRASLPQGSRLLSLECRTTMCKMEISHADERTANPRPGPSWMASIVEGWGEGSLYVAGVRHEGNEIVQTLIPLKGNRSPLSAAELK
jgi:hypothetical protein